MQTGEQDGTPHQLHHNLNHLPRCIRHPGQTAPSLAQDGHLVEVGGPFVMLEAGNTGGQLHQPFVNQRPPRAPRR